MRDLIQITRGQFLVLLSTGQTDWLRDNCVVVIKHILLQEDILKVRLEENDKLQGCLKLYHTASLYNVSTSTLHGSERTVSCC